MQPTTRNNNDQTDPIFIQWFYRGVVAVVVVGLVTWFGWTTVSISERPDRVEVIRLIKSEAPYASDRAQIQAQLARVSRVELDTLTVIRQNTEAINALKVEIARLQTRLGKSP